MNLLRINSIPQFFRLGGRSLTAESSKKAIHSLAETDGSLKQTLSVFNINQASPS